MNKIFIKSSIKDYFVEFKKINNFSKKKDEIYFIDNNFYKKNPKLFKNKLKKILITPSEKGKSFESLSNIFNKFFNLKPDRKTVLICVGGGILQDITSFLASITFRGIDWKFYPTTLLAQADSCIGGKTSINFRGSKNQIGNFYPPSEIFIDTNFLNSLDQKDILSGYGEMAHYYLLSDYKFQLFFKKKIQNISESRKNNIKTIIENCLKIKKKFIEKDEFDSNQRLLLNYGHTFGHAIEKYTSYKIPHGLAVAIGLDLANYISYKRNYLKKKNYQFMNEILKSIYNDINIKKLNINKFLKYLDKDKKNTKSHYGLILTKGPNKAFFKKINKKDKLFKKNIICFFNNLNK